MMAGIVPANAFAMLDKDRFTQRIASVIHDGDIEVTRPCADWEIIIAKIGRCTLGGCAVPVAPLINISHSRPSDRCTAAIQHLAQNVFARTEVIVRNSQQAIGQASAGSGACYGWRWLRRRRYNRRAGRRRRWNCCHSRSDSNRRRPCRCELRRGRRCR